MKGIVAVVSFLLICANAFSQKGYDKYGYPLYDSVAVRVAEVYSTQTLADKERYRLAKKPDGWYVCVVNFNTEPSSYDRLEMCWSKEKQSYTLPSEAPTDDSEQVLAQLKDASYSPTTFDLNLRYGYIGWTDDVFRELEPKVNLTDDELQALGRAYANEAYYRVGQWSDYRVEERAFNLEDKPNCMTPAQMDTFLFYEKKAIDAYHRLWKQNPAYETFVGNAYTKYSDEIMSTFLMLAHYQNMNEAMKFLDGAEMFDPFLLSFAKNLLNSCPPGAILITQGDNDTYPLYYAQAKLNYRRDVLIVNHSLVATSRYINFVRAGVFGAEGFPMRLKKEEYAGTLLDYLYLSDKRVKQLIEDTRLDVKPDAEYVLKNDIAVLDMLAANKWKRSVCFAMSVQPECLLGLSPHVVQRGLVYEVKKQKQDNTISAPYYARTDADFNYHFLLREMFFTDWATQPFIDENVPRLAGNYRLIFCRTAEELIKQGKKPQAFEVIARCLGAFPNEIVPFDVFICNAPKLLAESGQVEEGNRVSQILFQNAQKQFYEAKKDFELQSEADWYRSLREAIYVLEEVKDYAAKYFTDAKAVELLEKDFDSKKAEFDKLKEKAGKN